MTGMNAMTGTSATTDTLTSGIATTENVTDRMCQWILASTLENTAVITGGISASIGGTGAIAVIVSPGLTPT